MSQDATSKDVATDTINASTKAIDTKFTSMQFYVGRKLLFISVYGMNNHKEFVSTCYWTRFVRMERWKDYYQMEDPTKYHTKSRTY